MNTLKLIVTLLLMNAIYCFGQNAEQAITKRGDAKPIGLMIVSPEEFKLEMRRLWEDHVVWTRNVLLCIIDDLEGLDQAKKRLLKNQEDIGNIFKPYYGDEAGKNLTELLNIHIFTEAEELLATKTGNTFAFDNANIKLETNADQISVFLGKLNPNWKLVDIKMMLHDHLQSTMDIAIARKEKEFSNDVIAFDRFKEKTLELADVLADGIINQFWEKFKLSTEPLIVK